MKRDVRLRGLSSEHHRALVIARELTRGRGPEWLRDRFAAELLPHFAVEEELLLPTVEAAGGGALVTRSLEDHRALRALAAEGATQSFAERLVAHVRFEERELFPAWEGAQILHEAGPSGAASAPGPETWPHPARGIRSGHAK